MKRRDAITTAFAALFAGVLVKRAEVTTVTLRPPVKGVSLENIRAIRAEIMRGSAPENIWVIPADGLARWDLLPPESYPRDLWGIAESGNVGVIHRYSGLSV